MNGAEVRAIRLALHFTQSQMANRLGVSRASVSRWETETLRISAETEEAIRRVPKIFAEDLNAFMSQGTSRYWRREKALVIVQEVEKRYSYPGRNAANIIRRLIEKALREAEVRRAEVGRVTQGERG